MRVRGHSHGGGMKSARKNTRRHGKWWRRSPAKKRKDPGTHLSGYYRSESDPSAPDGELDGGAVRTSALF